MFSRAAVIVGLLLLNGYFVAVEFALVRARRTRLQAMARAGDPMARFALRAIDNLSRVLSASQLGITVASLGLGWVAEESLGHLVAGWFGALPLPIDLALRATLGASVALMAVTWLHVVFGELAPRAVALQHPEQFAKWLAAPLLAFAWVVTPFTTLLNWSASGTLRLFGQRLDVGHEAVHSPDELRILIEQSEDAGQLPSQDAELIGGVLEFSEKHAREVMTPRTEIVALDADASLDEALAVIAEHGFSRYPVIEESLDHVVGMLHVRELLAVLRRPPAAFTIRDRMREIHLVPGSREIEAVLADFQRRKEHLAIVLDEFGGTAGLVTMEDLLEEIVGEIQDEYDETTERKVPAHASNEILIEGTTPIDDANEQHGMELVTPDFTTVAGYVFGALGRLPVPGDRVDVGGGRSLVVREMDGRRIALLALERVAR
ncbi:MAG: hemolysin family protein [Gemmatimonadaceae bacterium]|nr:hemolysin family protein [Gemmatimonadaceae bacterium]